MTNNMTVSPRLSFAFTRNRRENGNGISNERGEASRMNRVAIQKPRAYGYARVNQAGIDRLIQQTEPLTRYIGQLDNYQHDPAADLIVEIGSGSGELSPKLR